MAALYVLLFHFSLMMGIDHLLLRLGVTGVDLFFMISGFVIFMTLETKSASQFIVSRLSRLYPAYIVMMAITSLAIYLFSTEGFPSAKTIFINLSMLQSLFAGKSIDESYWTLVVEMQFYVLMLLIFLTGKLRHIETVSLCIILLLACYSVLSASLYPHAKVYILIRSFLPLIGHFPLFFAGIVFYKMKKERMSLYRHGLILICFVFTLVLFSKAGKAREFIQLYEYAAIISLYFVVFYFFVAGKLKALVTKPAAFLGMISYSLYLLHQQFGQLLYFQFLKFGIGRFVSVLIVFAIVVLLSYLVTVYIERPVMRSIRMRFSGRPQMMNIEQA